MGKRLTQQQIAGRKGREAWQNHTADGLERLRQAALANRPWEKSTGPRTIKGKASSRRNGLRHGGRAADCLPETIQALEAALVQANNGEPLPTREAVAGALASAFEVGTPEVIIRCMRLTSRYTRLLLAALNHP